MTFKQHRKSLGYTVKELAPLLGYSWRSVEAWEEEEEDKKGTVFIGPDRKITGWRFEGDWVAIEDYRQLEQQLNSMTLAYKAWMVQELEVGEEYADKEIAAILSGQLDDIHKRVIKRWEDNNET